MPAPAGSERRSVAAFSRRGPTTSAYGIAERPRTTTKYGIGAA